MQAFTVIPCADPRVDGYVKVRNHCGGIEYIPAETWDRLSLAAADTRDADFAAKHRARNAVVGLEGAE